MSTYLFIIIAVSATKNIGLTLEYDKLAQKAEKSFGLGMGITKNKLGPNPFAPKVTVPQKEEPAKINPSIAQQQNKPQPIKVPGTQNKPKGPTGVISIFETDEDENITNGDFLRKKPVPNPVPKDMVGLDQNKKPATQPFKDTQVSGVPSLDGVSPKDKDGKDVPPFIDFSRMPNRFVLPFGVPATLLNTPGFFDNLKPNGGQVGKLALPDGQPQKPLDDSKKPTGETKVEPTKPKVVPQDTKPVTQETKVDENKNKEPVKKPEVIITPPQKTTAEIEIQTDLNGDNGIIRPEDLLPKDLTPKDQSPKDQSPKDTHNQGGKPDGLNIAGPQSNKGTQTPDNEVNKLPDQTLPINGQTDKIPASPKKEKDVLPTDDTSQPDIHRAASDGFLKPPSLNKEKSFHDDTEIDYGDIIPIISENDLEKHAWDTDFFKKTRLHAHTAIPEHVIPSLRQSSIKNKGKALKKIKRIYLIEVVRCKKCQDDPHIQDLADASH